MIRTGLLGVLLLTLTLGQTVAEEKKNPLVGKWQVRTIISNDTESKLELVLNFSADRAWLNEAKEKDQFKYTIDRNSNPFLMDLKTPDDKEIEGIWEIKGDELRLCICNPDNVKFRPTEFHGRENQILLILDRIKE